jgi:hypothetical protein
VLHIGAEEAIAEEVLLEYSRQRLDKVFGIGGREEGLQWSVYDCLCWYTEHTEPEYPRSPIATKSVRLFLLGLRKLSVYSSSSICHVSFRSFLKSRPRYLESDRLKIAKKAIMRASNPGRASASSSCCLDPVRKIARRMDELMSRSRLPMLSRSGAVASSRVFTVLHGQRTRWVIANYQIDVIHTRSIAHVI